MWNSRTYSRSFCIQLVYPNSVRCSCSALHAMSTGWLVYITGAVSVQVMEKITVAFLTEICSCTPLHSHIGYTPYTVCVSVMPSHVLVIIYLCTVVYYVPLTHEVSFLRTTSWRHISWTKIKNHEFLNSTLNGAKCLPSRFGCATPDE
jgi:hypothetical protein